MLFGRPDAFGNRNSARIYLDEERLASLHEQRADAAIHVIRDPFSLKQVPIIYYNAKFGVPPRVADQNELAQWRTREFRAVTEFQLRTHGVQLDEAQMQGFL